MKSDVPNSKMTVLQSHANDAARCIVFSAAGGNSLVVKFDITADAVPTASLIGSPAAAAMLAHVDRSEVDAGSMGSAGAGEGVMPALCALAEGSMTRQLLLPLHLGWKVMSGGGGGGERLPEGVWMGVGECGWVSVWARVDG